LRRNYEKETVGNLFSRSRFSRMAKKSIVLLKQQKSDKKMSGYGIGK
jgi:hypothetical protein